MTRNRSDPLYKPRSKYMSKLFTFQLTDEQHEKLGRLAARNGVRPISAAAWLRKKIDQGEL